MAIRSSSLVILGRGRTRYVVIFSLLCIMYVYQDSKMKQLQSNLQQIKLQSNVIVNQTDGINGGGVFDERVSITDAVDFGDELIHITAPILPAGKKLFVGILSAVGNYRQRVDIRETWKNFPGDWCLAFVVGLPYTHVENNENKTYADMILIHELDNVLGNISILPKKSTAIFYLAQKYKFDWIVKTDDDSFVNIPIVLQVLNRFSKPFYGGELYKQKRPIYDQSNKGFISPNQWTGGEFYPDYAVGHGYLLSTDWLPCLFSHISAAVKMPREDVFTGILAQECSIKPTQIDYIIEVNEYSIPIKGGIVLVYHKVKTRHMLDILWFRLYLVYQEEKQLAEVPE